MELFDVVARSIADTKASLWPGFAPELILCATIALLLIVRFCNLQRWIRPFFIVMVGGTIALCFASPVKYLSGSEELIRQELFSGMLVYDAFSVYVRSLLLCFAVLFAAFTWLSGVPDQEEGADFYSLVLGATLGMCLMTSANHFLMVFMAIEMASVPSYVLAATMKQQRNASEAALKYSVFGAGAAGTMLFGISLLVGLFGTAHVPTVATQMAAMLPAMGGTEKMVLALATLLIAVGLCFKLSAVPFHFWCPDVFEGAPAEIGAFLSIASKAAALALLVRLSIGTCTLPDTPAIPAMDVAVAQTTTGGLLSIADTGAAGIDALAMPRQFVALLWACIAAVTCTFGNLAAYGQTNMKRLLGYSTIAHAGYMLLAIPAALMMFGHDNEAANQAIAALGLYIAVYMFMNLSAFAIVASLRDTIGSEEIADYSGLIRVQPGIVICMVIALFSLVGIPPLAGFVVKFAIFASLVEGYFTTGNHWLTGLLLVGGLNTLLSLFYYVRVAKVMVIGPASDVVAKPMSLVSLRGAFIVLVTAPLFLLFLFWNGLGEWAIAATRNLF